MARVRAWVTREIVGELHIARPAWVGVKMHGLRSAWADAFKAERAAVDLAGTRVNVKTSNELGAIAAYLRPAKPSKRSDAAGGPTPTGPNFSIKTPMRTPKGKFLTAINLAENPGLGQDQITKFRQANIDLITTLGEDQISDLRDILESTDNLRIESKADLIAERLDIGERHAAFIARDQTAKLSAAITQTRQTQAGISQYEWNTSGDARVRESHEALDGTIQSWDDPPSESDGNHPGEDYQCRCVAIPVLPPLPEAGEDDEPVDEG